MAIPYQTLYEPRWLAEKPRQLETVSRNQRLFARDDELGQGLWLRLLAHLQPGQESGGKVRKGEKATLVVFWKQYKKTDKESGEEHTIPCLKHFNVFNAEQVEGITLPDAIDGKEELLEFDPIAAAEEVVEGYKGHPEIEQGGDAACYLPLVDQVRIAKPEHFISTEAYYSTLFHELTHSTGHKKRLGREIGEKIAVFGSTDYSKEELVAEMGSAFLAAHAGISPPTIEQSASYIDGWSKKIRGDKKLVVQAAGLAQRASDHILGVSFEEATP